MTNSDAFWKHLNGSYPEEFILWGVADHPRLEMLLSAIILVCYFMTFFGNTTIIVVSRLDARLHTPMYFFLSNLSFLDLCYTTSVAPQMLVNFWRKRKTIPYAACAVQMYIALALGATECLLLAAMAYDRYAAICQPLRYTAIMSRSVCYRLSAVSWLTGFIYSLVQTSMTLRLPVCGRNKVDHFFCEVPAVLKLACVETSVNEAVLLGSSMLIVVFPLGLITVSYCYITKAMLKIHSAQGRLKAFNTCASHFTVLTIFYGSISFSYLQPPSNYSHDQGKMMTFFYIVVAPMLNPLIYTLRNKEFHRALRRLMGKEPTT